MNQYMDGSLVTVSGTFKNSAGIKTNPTTTTLKVRVGVGASTTYVYGSSSITNPDDGDFDFEVDSTGLAANGAVVVTYEWIGTGDVQAIDAEQFEVVPAPL